MLCDNNQRDDNGDVVLRGKVMQTRLSKQQVIRKFINSAIYVEKPLPAKTVSSESLLAPQTVSASDSLESMKTKRCTCSIEKKTCPCHVEKNVSETKDEAQKSCPKEVKENKTKISQVQQSSKEFALKNWISKKEAEKKRKQTNQKMMVESQLKEKEILLEQKKENFKKWLMDKKKVEAEAKRKKQQEEEMQQLRDLEREKRQLETRLKFELWLKKKEEVNLERKIQKQMELIEEMERKERQLIENKKAFDEWLKNSKNKHKPLPMNRGIESLCSSTWVSYVNPNPWNPVP